MIRVTFFKQLIKIISILVQRIYAINYVALREIINNIFGFQNITRYFTFSNGILLFRQSILLNCSKWELFDTLKNIKLQMIKHSKGALTVLIIFLHTAISAQESVSLLEDTYCPETTTSKIPNLPSWAQAMYDEPFNVEYIANSYNDYYAENTFVKNQHTQFYKRLMRKHSRVQFDPSALDKKAYTKARQKYESDYKTWQNKTVGQWSTIGPYDLDLEAAGTGNTPGTAHIYHLDFCHGLSQHMLAGTATAGLWKSSNGASTWELITKDLLVNEVKAASYEPNNPSVIYFSSNHNFYKTINGGYDWEITGGATLENSYFSAYKIIINSEVVSEIFLATNIGLFRSTDSGENFDLILEGNIQDVIFHPTNHSIVYAIESKDNRTYFHRTMDSGEQFESFDEGYPIPVSTDEQRRSQLAVSADQEDAVWTIAVGKMNGGDGLVGIYKSENLGESWVRNCCGNTDGGQASATNPNIMEWECGGQSNGGQYYYDLALAVNPDNANQLITGGINLWKSEDSGVSMSCLSDFIYKHNPDTYVHADIHCIRYDNGKVWVASDGGIFMSDDNLQTFEKQMNGIVGTDFKGFDIGFFNKEIMVGGTYHNGTFLRENQTYINDWVSTRSGDNVRAFVNDGDNSIIYDHSSMRELVGDRMKIPHNVAMSRKPNASVIPGESSEIVVDPFHFNNIYLGQAGSLYQSENNGVTFERLKTFGSGRVTAIEKSPTNPALIYVVHYPSFSSPKKVMRSTNGGQSFTDVTPPASMFNNQDLWVAMDITIGSHNPFEIWLARVPQTTNGLDLDGLQVFYSANGGDTWVNWSSSTLDGEYPTNISHQHGSNGLVYLGTRRGVYYRSHNTSDWIPMASGIPASTYSTKLLPHYRTGTLVNATTRGVYEIPFVESSSAIAVPTVDKRESDCLRDTFYFLDRSPVAENATRLWTFEGAETLNSTDINPKVVYTQAGQYPVELQVTLPGSSASYTQQQFITVHDGCQIDSVVGSNLKLTGTAYGRVPPYKKTFSEMTITAWVKRQGVIYNSAGVVLHRSGPQGTGMILRSSGELSYLWDELDNNYHSGLIVPHNTWTHVAMAVNSNEVRLYVNGIEAKLDISLAPVELLESFYLGGDAFSITQYLSGNLDEISIYDRALSGEEIRLCMNLTQQTPLPGLLSYFQANNATGKLTDRVGHSHAYMMNSASRELSHAPVASGCAEMHVIDMPGTYDFDCADVSLTFEQDDILPMGPVSIAKLTSLPDMPNPEGTQISQNYWVLNNGGTNQNFSAPVNMEIGDFGYVDSLYTDYPEFHKLYKVPTYWEYGWGSSFDDADSITLVNNTTLIYDEAAGITSSGKLIFAQEGFPALSIADLDLHVQSIVQNQILLEWNFIPSVANYEVWRRTEGSDFQMVQRISHAEAKDLPRYIDTDPLTGYVYYQIKAIGIDEEIIESKIESVFLEDINTLRYYPNVLSQQESLQIENPTSDIVNMSIYDINGRLILAKRIQSNYENVALNIEAGQYVLEFNQGDQHLTGRIVVQ